MPSIRTILSLVILGTIILYIVPASTIHKIPLAEPLGLLQIQVGVKDTITQLVHSAKEVIQIFIGDFIQDMLQNAQIGTQGGLEASE